MGNKKNREIPLDVLVKGKALETVLQEYMRIYNGAKDVYLKAHPKAGEGEVFSEVTTAAVYRLYLLGVEDGMRNA